MSTDCPGPARNSPTWSAVTLAAGLPFQIHLHHLLAIAE